MALKIEGNSYLLSSVYGGIIIGERDSLINVWGDIFITKDENIENMNNCISILNLFEACLLIIPEGSTDENLKEMLKEERVERVELLKINVVPLKDEYFPNGKNINPEFVKKNQIAAMEYKQAKWN